jgi:hypothetical protein
MTEADLGRNLRCEPVDVPNDYDPLPTRDEYHAPSAV